MRKEETTSDYLNKSQWGDSEEVRTIKTTQKKKSKPAKDSKVSNTSEARKVGSKRKEKVSKERKVELIQNAKARVISNQSDLQELVKEAKKVSKSFKASKEKLKKVSN
jgi:predicted  nucleic acid-binding Zn-ribbon protein